MIKDHGIFSMMIILLTLSLDSVWILLGENCCWSLLGLKGLTLSHLDNVMARLLVGQSCGASIQMESPW